MELGAEGGQVEGLGDARADLLPVEPAQAAAERGDGDGADAVAADDAHEVGEAGVEVFQPGGVAPVPFGGEADDQPWGGLAGVVDVDPPWLQVPGGAGVLVVAVVGGPGAFELCGEPGAHDADGVDGVDQRVDVGGEQVPAGDDLDSWRPGSRLGDPCG